MTRNSEWFRNSIGDLISYVSGSFYKVWILFHCFCSFWIKRKLVCLPESSIRPGTCFIAFPSLDYGTCWYVTYSPEWLSNSIGAFVRDRKTAAVIRSRVNIPPRRTLTELLMACGRSAGVYGGAGACAVRRSARPDCGGFPAVIVADFVRARVLAVEFFWLFDPGERLMKSTLWAGEESPPEGGWKWLMRCSQR